MTTEQKILKLISENKGRARAHTVAKYLKFGNGYVEYLYKQLLKKRLIKKLKEGGYYRITRKGRKEIGEEIKPSKTTTKRKKVTKKGKKEKYRRKPKQKKKRIKKQRKSKPKIEKEKKEQLESLTPPTTETKEKKAKKGIIEVFKKLFAKPPEKTK